MTATPQAGPGRSTGSLEPVPAQVTSEVKRKHGSMPRWAVLGVGADAAGKLRLYWPWWSDINGERFLTRIIVIRNRWMTLEITRIHMADNQREHPHDHSHGFLSWVFGWYAETVFYDPDDLSKMRHVRHRRFGIHRLRHTEAHSITGVSPKLWTALMAGPVKQTSSYWTPGGKRSSGVNGDQESWA